MNKLFKFFLVFTFPLLAGIMVSCGDDTAEEEPLVAPSITAVNPTEGLPGTVVNITGTDLADVTEVRFGTMDADGFNPASNTATSISATVPAGIAAGAQTITVVGPGGEDTFLFTVLAEEMPVITSFAPGSGAVGTAVTVTGTDLDLATGAMLGEVAITDWAAATDGTSATFTVPEGAVTGRIVLMTESGEEVTSASDFTVETGGGGETGTIVESTDVVVSAQGNRNDEGVVTAFAADGTVYTLAEGVTVGEEIDFITADSGGDNELDLFSPSYDDWLPGNYFEDSEDQPVTWSYENTTAMRLIEEGEIDFATATAEEIMALEITGDPVYRMRLLPEQIGSVVFFITEEGEKGLLHYKASDLAEGKVDQFTFDIKVVQ